MILDMAASKPTLFRDLICLSPLPFLPIPLSPALFFSTPPPSPAYLPQHIQGNPLVRIERLCLFYQCSSSTSLHCWNAFYNYHKAVSTCRVLPSIILTVGITVNVSLGPGIALIGIAPYILLKSILSTKRIFLVQNVLFCTKRTKAIFF